MTGEAPEVISRPGKPLAVLLVEDNEPTRRAFARQLQNTDLTIAASATAAIAILRAEDVEPDVVLSDYYAGDGLGACVLREAMRLFPGARRYLMSGTPEQIDQAEAAKVAHRVVSKLSSELSQLLADLDTGRP